MVELGGRGGSVHRQRALARVRKRRTGAVGHLVGHRDSTGHQLECVPDSGARASRRDPRGGRATRSSRPRAGLLGARSPAGSGRTRRRGRARGGRRTRVSPATDERRSRRTNSLRSSAWRRSSRAVVRRRPPASAPPRTPCRDGRVLQQRLLLGRQRVEPRRDDPLHRLGQRQLRRGSALARACARTARRRADCRPRARAAPLVVGGEHGLVEQRPTSGGRLASESGESESVSRVRLAAAPAGPPLEQLRARRADDEQRHAAGPVDEVVDEVEQAVVGPVEVLEDEHERGCSASASKNRRQAANASSRGRSRASPPARPSSGRRCGSTQCASVASATSSRRRRASFASAASACRSSTPACALTISASAQKVTPSPYGRQRPWRQHDQLRLGVDELRKLEDQAALADPGHADERDELRRALLAHARRARRGATSSSRSPADERRRASAAHVDAEARARLDGLPDRDRLGLALRLDRARPRGSRSRLASPGRSPRRRGPRSSGRPPGAAPRCSRRRRRPWPRPRRPRVRGARALRRC